MNKTPASFYALTSAQRIMAMLAGESIGVLRLTSAIGKRTARRLEANGWGAVEQVADTESVFRINQYGMEQLAPMGIPRRAKSPMVEIAAPFITEDGKVSPLVPVAIIDRESDAGSYADALAHSVNIAVSDFNHSNHLPQEGK